MDLSIDLAEHLEGQYALPAEEEERAGFRFDSDSKADWGLRMLAKNRTERQRVLDLAREQHDVIDRWTDERLDALRVDERFFQDGVADYWRRELEPEIVERMDQGLSFDEAWAKVRSKSRKLPHGTLKGTRHATKVVLDDIDAFVAWAKANERSDLLSMPAPVPSKSAIAELDVINGAVMLEGEVLPGVHVEDPGVRWAAVPS